MWLQRAALLLTVCMLCCQTADADQVGLPEMGHPMKTHLINDARPVKRPENFSLEGNASCQDFFHMKYRRIDASCNNRLGKGIPGSKLDRLLPAAYENENGAPRQLASSGNQLPSARSVSLAVHVGKDVPTLKFTTFLMLMGQLIDHDIVATPSRIETQDDRISCGCESGGEPQNETEFDRDCFSIKIPADDPFFKNRSCMDFVRSEAANHTSDTRQQTNVLTSFIDGSTVYGSSVLELEELINHTHPHLLREGKHNFPPDTGHDDCVRRSKDDPCYLTGDERSNEHPGLTTMHIIFFRYHQLVAKQLAKLLPNTPKQEIFQMAREIVWAILQKISILDWLPKVLDEKTREQFSLDDPRTKRTMYDPSCDPSIMNVFATACFRFGHSFIPSFLPVENDRLTPLQETFFKPYFVADNMDNIVKQLAQATESKLCSQKVDRFISDAVTKHLFENVSQVRVTKGLDLSALNIQRGRDHGLPAYVEYRKVLGLPPVKSFHDAALGTGGENLKKVYEDMRDVDMFSGMLAEPPMGDGMLGETCGKIIAMQMRRLMFGDRYFFSHKRYLGFTERQVEQIRSVTLGHLLCLTTGITEIQKDVFVKHITNTRKKTNLVQCKDIRKLHGVLEEEEEDGRRPGSKTPRRNKEKKTFYEEFVSEDEKREMQKDALKP